MARPLRIHYAGALFHVMARGNGKQEIFRDDHDRFSFLDRLARLKCDTGFHIYAYCLMSNHFHVLMRVGNISLSEIMHRMLTGYSHEFNRKWERTGHLFEGRYKALHCRRDAYFRELVRYIHCNPVQAGLSLNPRDWRWSGYPELLGDIVPGLIDREYVLDMFAGRSALIRFVEERGDFDLGKIEAEQAAEETTVTDPPLRHPAALEVLEARIVGGRPISLSNRSKTRILADLRRCFVVEALGSGHRLAEIARFLGRAESVVSRIASRARPQSLASSEA